MRIWSLHPQYLDTKGLVALWRETLLAKKVLEGNTKGYTQHPQLKRFKEVENPVLAINQYLDEVWQEANRRGYRFDQSKIRYDFYPIKMQVTQGQLAYEWEHLMRKLAMRDEEKYRKNQLVNFYETLEMFEVIEGEIAEWEII